MIINPTYKPLPVRQTHRCFACSPSNHHGLKMRFYTDEKSLFSWLTIPEHLCGWNNLAHGGVLSTILDEIMSWTAIYMMRSFILTQSIAVDFKNPVAVGRRLRAEARMIEVNKRKATLEGLIFNENDQLSCRATGIFALVNLEMVRRLKIVDEKGIEDFQNMVESFEKILT